MQEYLKQIVRLPDTQKNIQTGEVITQYWHLYFTDAHKGVMVTENITNNISIFKCSAFGFMPTSAGAFYAITGMDQTVKFLTACLDWVRSLSPSTLKNMLYEHINDTITYQQMKPTNPQNWFDQQKRKENPPSTLLNG